MIHPSTMAGTNWGTGNFGTTNPFQQSSMPFLRTTPFQGPQAGYGPGISPFQNQPYGTNMMQMQNTINEVVRQIVPRILATGGIPPTAGLQSPFGQQGLFGQQGQSPLGQQGLFGQQGQSPLGQQGLFGQQSPLAFQNPMQPGLPSQTPPWMTPNPMQGDWQSWQNQNPLQEVVRLATIQAVQSLYQQNPSLISQGITGQSQPFQGLQNPWQQQQLTSLVGQVCQAVTSSVIEALTQPSQMQHLPYSQGISPFTPQQTPFYAPQTPQNIGGVQPQYGVPSGAGAF